MSAGNENDQSRAMTIINGKCWKCEELMKVAVTEGEISSYCGPDEFTPSELLFARNKGVIIKEHESKTAGETYLANTCAHCGTLSPGSLSERTRR